MEISHDNSGLFDRREDAVRSFLGKFRKELKDAEDVVSWMRNRLAEDDLPRCISRHFKEQIRNMQDDLIFGLKEDIKRLEGQKEYS